MKDKELKLKDVSKWVDKWHSEKKRAVVLGETLGQQMRKAFPRDPISKETREKYKKEHNMTLRRDNPDDFDSQAVPYGMAKFFDQFIHYDWDGDDSAYYMSIESALEHFWGLQIEQFLPMIEEIWQILHDNKITVRNQIE